MAYKLAFACCLLSAMVWDQIESTNEGHGDGSCFRMGDGTSGDREDSNKDKKENKDHNNNVVDNLNNIFKRAAVRGPIVVRKWDKQVVTYSVMNYPACSEISPSRIRALVDKAAGAWNKVEGANILLKDIAELEVETNQVYTDEDIDIRISFFPCQHSVDDTSDTDFVKCASIYGHAIYPQSLSVSLSGDIHLNQHMTWTDMYYDSIAQGELIKPNLYSIMLHELGHSLGLTHNSNPASLMYYDFKGSTSRAFTELSIGGDTEQELRALYEVQPSSCRDKYDSCIERDCNDIDLVLSCEKTCGMCSGECDAPVQDDYIKCNPDICDGDTLIPLLYCKKTCKVCETPIIGCPEPAISNGTPVPIKPLYDVGEEVQVACNAGFEPKDLVLSCVLGPGQVHAQWQGSTECRRKRTCEDKHQNCEGMLINPKKRRTCKQRKMKRICKRTCNLCK